MALTCIKMVRMALCAAIATASAWSLAQTGADADILAARDAALRGNWKVVDAYRARLAGHVLESYPAYWLLAGNLELRFPLMGVLSQEIRYGPVPLEGFLFSDAGLVWSRSPLQSADASGRSLVGSFGAGVRINALGLPLEFSAVRALRPPAVGWSFDFSLRTGF